MGSCYSRGDRFSDSETTRGSSDRPRPRSARDQHLIATGVNPHDWPESSRSQQESPELDITHILTEQRQERLQLIQKQKKQLNNIFNASKENVDNVLSSQAQQFQDMLKKHLNSLEPLMHYGEEVKNAKKMVKEMLKFSKSEMNDIRLKNIAEKLNIHIPNIKTNVWKNFASEAFDEISENNKLLSGEQTMLGDILQGGKKDMCTESDRNSKRYEELMTLVLQEWKKIDV